MWSVFVDTRTERVWVASSSEKERLCEKAGFVKIGTLDMGCLFVNAQADAKAIEIAERWAEGKKFSVIRL